MTTGSPRSSDSSKTPKYFDLITNGVGRLHRVREVPVRRGPPTLACGIKGLHGIRGSASTVPYDLNVVGHDAKDFVRVNANAANDIRQDVLVKFTVGDSRIHTFPLDGGGEGTLLKGRLLRCERFAPSPEISEYALITRGIGYLNFIRNGDDDDSLVCGINALVGREDEVAKVPFDVNVVDEGMTTLIREYLPYVKDRHDVLVGFTLRGAQIHSFPRSEDHPQELGYAVRSQLSALSFVTVDGKRVYNASRPVNESSETPSESMNVPTADSCAA